MKNGVRLRILFVNKIQQEPVKFPTKPKPKHTGTKYISKLLIKLIHSSFFFHFENRENVSTSVRHLLDDEVKVGEGQHEDAEQRGDGAVDDWSEHEFERHLRAPVASADAGHEADEDVQRKIDSDSDGHDEDDGRSGTQFDAQKTQNAKQFDDHRGQHQNDDSSRPDAHQRQAQHQEDGHQDAGQGQEQEEAQLQVLLPEGERNSGRKVGQSAVFEFLANGAHLGNF